MSSFTRRRILAGALAATALPQDAAAVPRRYRIDPADAEIRFIFIANGTAQPGTAPLSRADLKIDPARLEASTADVTADLTRVRAGLVLVTQALKGADMLDTARHPTARFRSTGVRLGAAGRLSDGAIITGGLTLRGVTRPLRLDASVYRPPGTAPDDLDLLDVRLGGRISRGAYGISGFADLVDDTVRLDIRVRIRAAG